MQFLWFKKVKYIFFAFIYFSCFFVNAQNCPDIDSMINFDFPAKINNLNLYLKQQRISRINLQIKCDTDTFLQQLFQAVTLGAEDDSEKVKKWVVFLQKRFYHSCYPPIDDHGEIILHPIWLLQNRGAQCGQVARVVVDGLMLNGIKSRLVQLNGHVVAEAKINGKYRFIDSDALNVGEFILNEYGEWASLRDIISNKELVSSVISYEKMKIYYPICKHAILNYNSNSYSNIFTSTRYGQWTTPFTYLKTASKSQRKNIFYGWNLYITQHYT